MCLAQKAQHSLAAWGGPQETVRSPDVALKVRFNPIARQPMPHRVALSALVHKYDWMPRVMPQADISSALALTHKNQRLETTVRESIPVKDLGQDDSKPASHD